MGPYWDWPGAWHMWGGFGWLFPLLVFAACVFLMFRMFGGHAGSHGGDTTSSALRMLNERFARGEISKEELEEKRAALGGRS